MYNIIFKTIQSTGFAPYGFGLCSFTEACPEPVKLIDVNGTLTITDGKNKLIINIVNDVISIPILIDEDITGKTNITIQEVNNQSRQNSSSSGSFVLSDFGTSNSTQIKKPTTRFYQLSIGKLFKTRFYVKDNEFHAMAKEMAINGGYSNTPGNFNVIEMNISFRTESGLQLISKK